MIEEITDILNRKKGESLIYHRGQLGYDRQPQPGCKISKQQLLVNETANIAWQLYEEGKISLVQRRHSYAETPNGSGEFDYIAVKR